jgi:hypothetical protein
MRTLSSPRITARSGVRLPLRRRELTARGEQAPHPSVNIEREWWFSFEIVRFLGGFLYDHRAAEARMDEPGGSRRNQWTFGCGNG